MWGEGSQEGVCNGRAGPPLSGQKMPKIYFGPSKIGPCQGPTPILNGENMGMLQQWIGAKNPIQSMP